MRIVATAALLALFAAGVWAAPALTVNGDLEVDGSAAIEEGLAVGTTTQPTAKVFRPPQGTTPPTSGVQNGDLFVDTDGGADQEGALVIWWEGAWRIVWERRP